MRISIFPDSVAIAGRPVYQAFVDYIQNHTKYSIVEDDYTADCAIIWSVLWHGRMWPNHRVYRYFREQNKPVIILEVGALKRNTTWRVSVNHIDNTGHYGNQTLLDVDRPRKLGLELQPWQDNRNGHILICGQHDKSELWQPMPDHAEWVEQVIQNIRQELDNPIVFRPHPRCSSYELKQIQDLKNVAIMYAQKVEGTYDDFDFDQAIQGAAMVYTHTSNAGIHAVINGIPVYCSDNALARPVRVKENNIHPDRDDWFLKLCHTEWTVDEISAGIPFKRIERFIVR